MSANGIRVAAGFGVGILLTIFYFNQPQNSGEWASWVQAVGSIGAILVAIWVLRKQNAQAIERENDEILQLLFSLQDEISVTAEGFAENGGKALLALTSGAFTNRVPLSENAFVVYNGSTSKVGKIKDHELRKLIVKTYARAFGFIRSIQMNNVMIDRWHEAELAAALSQSPFWQKRVADIRFELDDYGPKLREGYRSLRGDVEKLLEELQLLRK